MFIFRILGIFGFFTGPLIMAFVGALSLVRIWDLFNKFAGFTGTTAEVARGGIFVSTVGAITAAAGMKKVTSKLQGIRRAVVGFGDDVNSPERDRERKHE